MRPPPIVIAEELFGLLVACSGIDQDQALSVFDQEAPGGDINHVVGICRIGPGPQGFWHHAKHGPSIQLKISGFNRVKRHGRKNLARKYELSRSFLPPHPLF